MADALIMPTNSQFKNRTGQIFDRLTVGSYAGKDSHRKPCWNCVCICGKTTVVTSNDLVTGNTKSCGCRRVEVTTIKNTVHGYAFRDKKLRPVEYATWCGIHQRCENPTCSGYYKYGARGIKVDPFFDTFENFIDYMGPSGGLTIERINNNGNYAPGNVKWGTHKEQSRNKRNNVFIVHDDIQYVLEDAIYVSRKTHRDYYAYLKTGMTPQQAFDAAPIKPASRR